MVNNDELCHYRRDDTAMSECLGTWQLRGAALRRVAMATDSSPRTLWLPLIMSLIAASYCTSTNTLARNIDTNLEVFCTVTANFN